LYTIVGLVLVALLATACGARAATATHVPPTPRPSPVAQVGHWEGVPGVSFEVGPDGDIRSFKLVELFGSTLCTVELQEIPVEVDGAFQFSHLIPEEDYAFKGMVTPVVTDAGATVEAQHISGRFDSATTVTGTYKILVCGDRHYLPLEKEYEILTWSAEWKGQSGE